MDLNVQHSLLYGQLYQIRRQNDQCGLHPMGEEVCGMYGSMPKIGWMCDV